MLQAPKYLKHRLILGVLFGCLLRSYELCDLKLNDVDFGRKTVFIPKKKGTVDRSVPLSHHLARGLKKYIATENPPHYLFNSQVTKDGVSRGLTTNGVGLEKSKKNSRKLPGQKSYRIEITTNRINLQNPRNTNDVRDQHNDSGEVTGVKVSKNLADNRKT